LIANLIKLFKQLKTKLMKRLIFFAAFIVLFTKAFAVDSPIDLTKPAV